MPSTTARTLQQHLEACGARVEDVVMLNSASPAQHIRYLDIVNPSVNDKGVRLPKAIVEIAGRPVLYVVDALEDARPDAAALARLRRILAFRAAADHVAIVEPGKITVFPVGPSNHQGDMRSIGAPEARTLIPSIAFAPAIASKDDPGLAGSEASALKVHELLFDLLTATTNALIARGMGALDALSLVGRALFVRFLVDRCVLLDKDVEGICGARTETCFADPLRANQMSDWLDKTFNGDFLPLPTNGSAAFFKKLDPGVFHELSNILHRATSTGQTFLNWGTGWNDLLFDHIPVGLLSQVYEAHAHRFDADLAKMTSVHYTPRHVAEYMVEEIFFALGDTAHRARVLDPAVGGGVFLVAAFRRLAAERWRIDGKPANTQALRSILYEQLRGFDISEHALRLCSLGLYLTAVELDPNPRPPKSLRFDVPLLGTVLTNVRAEKQKHIYIGSLDGKRVGNEHRGQYDVVIGNPPWSTWKARNGVRKADVDAQVAEVTATVKEIVRKRLGDDEAQEYEMAGYVPDLPFFWRAVEWAKPDGLIALALHGRLLFKQASAGRRAREQIFRAVQVTGIVNGTDVRDTKFWRVRAPFCLFFARNRQATGQSSFWFVSPTLEKASNDRGQLRIDATSAWPVPARDVQSKPWLLKALFRGTQLDLRVLEQMERVAPRSVGAYWEEHWGQRRHGVGYKDGGAAPPRGKKPAEDLWGMPNLTRDHAASYFIDTQSLGRIPYGQEMQHQRRKTIYDAPLVLIAESPPVNRDKPAAHLVFGNVAYSQSFTGFSCADHPDGKRLASYLFLLLNSDLVRYVALLESSKFGIERDIIDVLDVARFPFLPVEDLPNALKSSIAPLTDALIREGNRILADVDAFAASVYGLGPSDCEVIRDTLEVASPFAHARIRAQSRPSSMGENSELQNFADRVASVIRPFLVRQGRTATVRILLNDARDPWIILQVDSHLVGCPAGPLRNATALAAIIDQADSLAATQMIAVEPASTLLIAIVAQYRYFTPSRARLLGLELVHEHADTLLGKGA